MKIISSTSMMSTIGVTLISDCRWSAPPCIPMTNTPSSAKRNSGSGPAPQPQARWPRLLRVQLLRAVLDEVINQLGSRVVHFHHEAVDLAGEIVEQPHRRNRDYEPQCGSEQGFRNTAGHGCDTCGFGVLHATEGVDDAEHGAEQSYERRGRADSCQA